MVIYWRVSRPTIFSPSKKGNLIETYIPIIIYCYQNVKIQFIHSFPSFFLCLFKNLRCLVLFLFLFGLCEFFIFFPSQYFLFSSAVKEVSHKIKGLRSLSMDQSSSLKSEVFSILKRESKDVVACKFKGDNLLWSNKNCCFLVISYTFIIHSFRKKANAPPKNRLLDDFLNPFIILLIYSDKWTCFSPVSWNFSIPFFYPAKFYHFRVLH